MSMGLSTRFVKFPPPISMGMRHAVNLVLALAHVAFTASSIVLSLTPQGEPSSLWQKLSVAAPITKFKLVLNYTEAAPDGFRQTLKLVNGMLDYPIVVNAGDSVEIAVTNALDEPTAIHWHGLFQRGTPWMDGAAMVTQCPIQPGETFVYKFSVGDQVGSYWYHAHHKAQYVDGLRGPFIVKDSKAPFADQYDDEIVITLADLFHNKSSFLLDYFFSPNEGTLDPVPESLLINGVGYYPCQFAPLGSKCTPTTFPSNEVVFGKRYLLRIINMSGEAAFTFSIDGHNLTVVEADGVYTVPTVVDQFPITAGQRYSVILNANAKVSNYWIRADLDEQLYFPAPIDLNGLVPYARSILRYKGAAKTNPTTKAAQNPTVLNPFNLGEYNGTPLTQLVPHLGDTMYMNFKILSDGDNNITTATVSAGDFVDSQWQPPSYPTILDVLDDVRLPDSTNGVEVSNDSYLLLHITNDDPMEHPFHLHGHTFWILLSGKLLFAPSTLPSANYTVGLPRRDTIQVPPCTGGKGGSGEDGCVKGYVAIIIHFNNPGAWLFHCHIEWHMAAGLALTFVNSAGLKGERKPDGIEGVCKRDPGAPPTSSAAASSVRTRSTTSASTGIDLLSQSQKRTTSSTRLGAVSSKTSSTSSKRSSTSSTTAKTASSSAKPKSSSGSTTLYASSSASAKLSSKVTQSSKISSSSSSSSPKSQSGKPTATPSLKTTSSYSPSKSSSQTKASTTNAKSGSLGYTKPSSTVAVAQSKTSSKWTAISATPEIHSTTAKPSPSTRVTFAVSSQPYSSYGVKSASKTASTKSSSSATRVTFAVSSQPYSSYGVKSTSVKSASTTSSSRSAGASFSAMKTTSAKKTPIN